MKKLLALVLVLGLASVASAGIVDVVTDNVGDVTQGQVVNVKLVLNENIAFPTYPSYDGYLLSSFDFRLAVTGPATLAAGISGKGTAILADANVSPFSFTDVPGDQTIEQMTGVATNPVNAEDGAVDLVWNILLTVDADAAPGALITVDLILNGTSQYSVDSLPGSNAPYSGWQNATDEDLGDASMNVVVPEPMTMSLLAIGGMALIRRRRA